MRNIWKVAVAVACVCVLAVAVFATPGSENDPLVTLTYLTNIFRPQIMEQVKSEAETQKAALEDQLNGVLNERFGVPADDPAPESDAAFTVVTLASGQVLTGDVGCEAMLRIGTAQCISPDSPGLIDVTAGTILENDSALETNHLYMVTISTRSITCTSETCKLLVRGPYTIA